jgi:hypothetical protein
MQMRVERLSVTQLLNDWATAASDETLVDLSHLPDRQLIRMIPGGDADAAQGGGLHPAQR